MNSIAVDFANLLTKGTEQIIDLQKKALDTAAQYEAEAVETFKKVTPCATGTSLFELQGKAFERYVAVQKSVLDVVQKQTTALTQSTQANSDVVSKAMNNVADIFKRSLEQGLAVQQSVVDAASQQYNAMADAVKA